MRQPGQVTWWRHQSPLISRMPGRRPLQSLAQEFGKAAGLPAFHLTLPHTKTHFNWAPRARLKPSRPTWLNIKGRPKEDPESVERVADGGSHQCKAKPLVTQQASKQSNKRARKREREREIANKETHQTDKQASKQARKQASKQTNKQLTRTQAQTRRHAHMHRQSNPVTLRINNHANKPTINRCTRGCSTPPYQISIPSELGSTSRIIQIVRISLFSRTRAEAKRPKTSP